MKELVQELAEHCDFYIGNEHSDKPREVQQVLFMEKFAELIIQECAEVIEKRAPGQMGTKGEGWTNGYDDGLMTGAFIIKRHFGVES
jgi:6-pyruvoyl-tetrahydropterin synthase